MSDPTIDLAATIEQALGQEQLRHALLLTYGFDGPYIEDPENGVLETIWRHECDNVLVIRDAGAVHQGKEKRAHRYSVVNAGYSTRTFHPKLFLLLSESSATAVVGSANLTRGGLEANLELVGVHKLTRDRGPHRYFSQIHRYLLDHLGRELAGASPEQRRALKLITDDLALLLREAKPPRQQHEPVFLHNYRTPLWPQILAHLPSHDVEELWVVSPFFEVSSTEEKPVDAEDPREESDDGRLLTRVFRDLPSLGRASRRSIRIYFRASDSGRTLLPVEACRRHRKRLALYRNRATGVESRPLHAKLLVFAGRGGNNRRFVTVVHGSANFTPSALLSRPPLGNAEIVSLLTLPGSKLSPDQLVGLLSLRELFQEVKNWSEIKPVSVKQPRQDGSLRILEAVVSLARRTVTVYVGRWPSAARGAAVFLEGCSSTVALGEHSFDAKPPTNLALPLPPGLTIELSGDGGVRQFPFRSIRMRARDEAGAVLAEASAPLNVDCPETFCLDWQCVPEDMAVDRQILRAGIVSTSGYVSMRRKVETALSSEAPASPPVPAHQAALDTFFRNVHLGFRGMAWQLRQGQGSLYTLRRVMSRLASCSTMIGNGPPNLTPEQRLYIAERIVRAVLDAAESMKKARCSRREVCRILTSEFSDAASRLQATERELRGFRHLAVATLGLRRTLKRLKEQVIQ